MTAIYKILVFGSTETLHTPIVESIERIALEFDLHLGLELVIEAGSAATEDPVATVVIYIGSINPTPFKVEWVIRAGIPIIPIVEDGRPVAEQIPNNLAHLNAVIWNRGGGVDKIAAAAMESLRLLPEQRRVFISYVRAEASDIALQIFAELESRQFQVFVDTHDIRPGAAFQARLWHRLCESDVMVMLDTPSYFQRRWTREEFGKANLKKAAILRVALPGAKAISASVNESVEIDAEEIDSAARLNETALDKVCDKIEFLRSQSIAVRNADIVGHVRTAAKQIGASVSEPGQLRRVQVTLPGGKQVLVYPAVGVPTANLLNIVADHANSQAAAIAFDRLGIQEEWLSHLNWLGAHVPEVKWIQTAEVAWRLLDWDGEL